MRSALQVLRTKPDDVVAQCSAMAALREASMDVKNRVTIVRAGALVHCKRWLGQAAGAAAASAPPPALVRDACAVVAYCSTKSENYDAVVGSGVLAMLGSVLDVAAGWRTDGSTAAAAAAAAADVTMLTCSALANIARYAPDLSDVVTAASISRVRCALQQQQQSGSGAAGSGSKEALRLVSCLTSLPDNGSRARFGDVVSEIVGALEGLMGDAQAVAYGWGALGNISGDAAQIPRVRDAGVLPLAVLSLRQHATSAESVRCVLWALANLTADPLCREIVMANGALPLILLSLNSDAFPFNEEVVNFALAVVSNLASDQLPQVLATGAVPLVLAVM
jgi:hypothetical protein